MYAIARAIQNVSAIADVKQHEYMGETRNDIKTFRPMGSPGKSTVGTPYKAVGDPDAVPPPPIVDDDAIPVPEAPEPF